MDELAYALNIDPLELRLRNYADDRRAGEQAVVEQGAARVLPAGRRGVRLGEAQDGAALDARRRAGSSAGAWRPRPIRRASMPASALATDRSPTAPSLVQAGTQDIGTGTYTIMTQIAADALGVPIDDGHVRARRHRVPETPVSGGSMTASSTGSAVKLACAKLRTQLDALKKANPRRDRSGRARAEDRPARARRRAQDRARQGPRQVLDALVRRGVRRGQGRRGPRRSSGCRASSPRTPPARSSTRRPRAASSSAASCGRSAWRSRRRPCAIRGPAAWSRATSPRRRDAVDAACAARRRRGRDPRAPRAGDGGRRQRRALLDDRPLRRRRAARRLMAAPPTQGVVSVLSPGMDERQDSDRRS